MINLIMWQVELNRQRREVDESNKRNDQAFAQYRKKHDDAVAEMQSQIEHLLKVKTKLEKERLSLIANNDQSRVPTGFLDKNEVGTLGLFCWAGTQRCVIVSNVLRSRLRSRLTADALINRHISNVKISKRRIDNHVRFFVLDNLILIKKVLNI